MQMVWRKWTVWLLLPLWLVSLPVRAVGDDGDDLDPDEIPQVGRPPDLPFSEASGNFRIEMDADPTRAQVDEPLILTVRITATAPVRKPPRPLPLNDLPAFRQAFHIEPLPDRDGKVVAAARLAGMVLLPGVSGLAVLGPLSPRLVWDFHYQLKPKSTAVREIPSLPFVFYNPRILSPERRFQVLYADAVPLEVRPREVVQVPLQAPARACELGHGSALLARQSPWTPPGLLVWLGWFLCPPALCLVWYLTWRHLYPDAVKLARLRRSRAAALALEVLQRLPPASAQRAVVAVSTVTRYLRQRLDLPG